MIHYIKAICLFTVIGIFIKNPLLGVSVGLLWVGVMMALELLGDWYDAYRLRHLIGSDHDDEENADVQADRPPCRICGRIGP